MKHYLYAIVFFGLASCQPAAKPGNQKQISPRKKEISTNSNEKTIRFLWRENLYDKTVADTVSTIIINDTYAKTLSNPEKAALGYVATFIGNDCWWDGESKEDRSNLKCKILTALQLGYQCSPQHLGFLRQWFNNDQKVLKELENCPTTPYTATVQDTFDEITLTKRGGEIKVFFKANGVNMRAGDSWTWSETDYFQVEKGHIKLINKEKSEVKHAHFDN